MLKLGGPIFLKPNQEGYNCEISNEDELGLLIKKIKQKGWKAAYVPIIDLNNTALIAAARRSFKEADIIMAEYGFWENMLDLAPDVRLKNREGMVKALQLAEELGAYVAENVLGSYCYGSHRSHQAKNFSQEAFDEAVEIAQYCLDTVKPKTTCFAFEIYQFNAVDSCEQIEKLIKAVDRKQFAVHLDLVNLINSPREYFKSNEILKHCLDCFGDRIISVHVKDVKMFEGDSVIFEEVPYGQGNIDFKTCIKELNKLPQTLPYMMEHLKDEKQYDEGAAFLRKEALQAGITL